MATNTPVTPHLGIELDGISSRELVSAGGAEECKELLHQFGFVAYRNVNLDDDQLIEFSSMMGELVVASTGEHRRPEIQTITSNPEQTTPMMASIRRGNFLWHFDGANDVTPQQGTFLAAREVTNGEEGGTQFASSYIAYDTLPDADKALIADLRVEHSFAAAQRQREPRPDV